MSDGPDRLFVCPSINVTLACNILMALAMEFPMLYRDANHYSFCLIIAHFGLSNFHFRLKGPQPWNHNKYPCFYIIPLEFGGNGDIHTYKIIGAYVKTAIIHHLKCLCVPDCTYMESMFINFIHMSMYTISPMQTISKEMWLYERDSDAPSTCS